MTDSTFFHKLVEIIWWLQDDPYSNWKPMERGVESMMSDMAEVLFINSENKLVYIEDMQMQSVRKYMDLPKSFKELMEFMNRPMLVAYNNEKKPRKRNYEKLMEG